MVSLVVSVFNEEDVLSHFLENLETNLSNNNIEDYEIIFVNDGSLDKSAEILTTFAKNNQKILAIHFSRNFGHEAAMLAGIDHSQGQAIICLDCDLQHPPELIPKMLEEFDKGYEIVNMIRKSRQDGGLIKKITSKLFYRLLNSLSEIKFEANASDFFLISERIANILRNDYRERTRYLRGFIQLLGFKKTTLVFDAPERQFGKSKYGLFKLLKFSLSAISTISQAPLKLSILIGFFYALLSVGLLIFSLIMKFLGDPYSGYTTLIVFVSLSFSILFFLIGIIGEYIGNLFVETKSRPLYLIDKISK